MTDTTPMRDRLALAAAVAMDLPDHKGYEAVDAILSVLETPSESVCETGAGELLPRQFDGGRDIESALDCFTAMVKTIRSGA